MSQLYDICRVVSRRISHFLSMKANINVHGNYSLRPFFKKKKKKKKYVMAFFAHVLWLL